MNVPRASPSEHSNWNSSTSLSQSNFLLGLIILLSIHLETIKKETQNNNFKKLVKLSLSPSLPNHPPAASGSSSSNPILTPKWLSYPFLAFPPLIPAYITLFLNYCHCPIGQPASSFRVILQTRTCVHCRFWFLKFFHASSSPAEWARDSSPGSGTRRPSLFGSSDLSSGVSCYPPRTPYFWAMLCAAPGPRLAGALGQEWPHSLCPQNSAWGSPGFSRSLHKGHVLSETVPLSQPKAHLLTLSWEFRSAFESALSMSRCVVDNCLVSVSPAPRESGAASPLHPAAIQAH